MLKVHAKVLQGIIKSYNKNNGRDLYDHIDHEVIMGGHCLSMIHSMPCINDSPRQFWQWVERIQAMDTRHIIHKPTICDIWPMLEN